MPGHMSHSVVPLYFDAAFRAPRFDGLYSMGRSVRQHVRIANRKRKDKHSISVEYGCVA